MAVTETKNGKRSPDSTRKARVLQSDVPRHTLKEALRIPQAITDEYAGADTKPLHVAAAVELAMNSSQFRMLVGASAAYGLTTGAWNSEFISLTPLGKRATAQDGADKQIALREAFLKPRVIGAFLRRYSDNRFPKESAGQTILSELGVPKDSTDSTLTLISVSANELGMIREIKGSQYVDLDGLTSSTTSDDGEDMTPGGDEDATDHDSRSAIEIESKTPKTQPNANSNRVFVTHGKNIEIVSQIKELLTFGNFLPIVAAERETVSKPVPDKVMDDMRTCSAAIIHVGKEIKLLDQEGQEHIFLNQNVLIEIGAAMALYGRKFILLVERGATLPSNLQGLYEVRYEGDKLDYDATMKLLKAFNDFRQ